MERMRVVAGRSNRLRFGAAPGWLAVALWLGQVHAQGQPADQAGRAARAQDPGQVPADLAGAAAHGAAGCDMGSFTSPQACDDESRRRFRTRALMFGSIGVTAAYGRAKWWQDGFESRFKNRNEGWFGGGTAYGGADKLGHAMSAYSSARLLARAYEWAGNDTRSALGLGIATSVGTMLGVEVLDAYAKKWHFSHEDAVANLVGGALAWWLETDPVADALLDFRIQYSRSSGPEGRRSFDPFGDYSGQRYLMVFKARGMPALCEHPVLRYLEFNVGYGTRNFESEARLLTAPTRHVHYGIALNLTELLRATVWRGSESASRAQRVSETFFEYVQVPAATAGGERVWR